MKRYKTVDDYVNAQDHFHDEVVRVREILLSIGLAETVKWGRPCYMHAGQNVVGLSAFKDYFGIWFFQGGLLEDKQEKLVNAQEGKTRAMRQWRMASGQEIKPRLIKAYVKEAIALQEQGKAIKPDRRKPLTVPPPLADALKQNAKAGTAFAGLTKGKQREYAEYIADAKRENTKATRIAKIVPMIVAGKGLNDKYR